MATTTSQIPSLQALAGLAGLLAGLLAGPTPANADIYYSLDFTAKVTFDRPELVLECIETLRPDGTPEVTLELIEVPDKPVPRPLETPTPGNNLSAWLDWTGRMIEFANTRAFMASKTPTPEFLRILNARYKGRMNIKYEYDNNPDRAQQLKRDGFRLMNKTRPVTIGEGDDRQSFTISRYYRTNSADIPSYGTARAMFTLRSHGETNTLKRKYKAGYRPTGKIEYEYRNRPSSAEGLRIFAELKRDFKTRMIRKRKRIVDWLNQARPLFRANGLATMYQKNKGDVLDTATEKNFDVEEIKFPFCGKPQTVVPRVVVTVGDERAVTPEGGSVVNRPLGD